MFRAVSKLKMIECSFSPAVLPFSPSFCWEGREAGTVFFLWQAGKQAIVSNSVSSYE